MKRPAAFTAAIALLTGGLVAGVAAPASAVGVGNYSDLALQFANDGATVELLNDIEDLASTLSVDVGESITLDLKGFELHLVSAPDFPGIGVPPTSKLTVIDTGAVDGVLDVSVPSSSVVGAAGIGGTGGQGSGTIVIDDASVGASGSDGGAGIGGGPGGTGGTTMILDGFVQAASGSNGAGIGGGDAAAGGSITISGGDVSVVGFSGGAGIGGGENAPGGTIAISGGIVRATSLSTSGDGGAGIGGGAGPAGDGGSITITGGEVTALGSGFGGAGIGGGAGATAGTISLLGGDITARAGGDAGAAIGTGGGFLGLTPPTATVAGSPQGVQADRGAKGTSSFGADYLENNALGITYTATSLDVPPAGQATSTLEFFYTVTFDADADTPDPGSQTVAWGDLATSPPVPTKAGYVFDGWHVTTAGGVLWDFSDPVTGPLLLVAAWLQLPDISGAASANAPIGAAFSYTPIVTPPGFTVAADTLPAGLSIPDPSTGEISGVPTGPIGSTVVTLTATNAAGDDSHVVTINVVAGADQLITFLANGGSATAPQMVGLGETVVEPSDPVRVGYAFIEWRVGTDAGPAYDFNQVVTGPLTLVAAWGQQPTLTGPATRSGTAGDPITTVQLVTTPLGNTVGITSGTLPAGLTFTPGTLQVTGVPNGLAGTYPVTFTASNAYGLADHVVTFTIAHGIATSFTTTASDFSPDQGDTITVTTTASDGFGNSWDASADATITSDVATDVIVGNQVTFPHASPHVLTVSLPNLAAQQLVVNVTARRLLGLTGSAGALAALPIAILTILCGTSLMLLRRRSEA